MKFKDHLNNFKLVENWRVETDFKFNCLCPGRAFRHDLQGLVVGGEEGIIRIFDLSQPINVQKPQITLETKGGPIQTIAIHDVTKFYNDDLVVGDSYGTLTVFCNQQILCRHSIANDSIQFLQIHSDQVGNSCIVTSDESGYITALLPSKELWKINVNNLGYNKGLAHKTVITCLLSTELTTPNGEKCSYILAADDNKHLHFVHQGRIVMTLDTPSVITAMCAGVFVDSDKLEVGDPSLVKDRTQVALGCSSGAIYILHNFTITEEEFGNANYHITQLKSHPRSGSRLDYILCSGHFNALHVYHEGKKVDSHDTPDWINSLAVTSVTKDVKQQIIVGCLDKTILALSFVET